MLSEVSATAMTALFIQQSLIDSQSDYKRSISSHSFPKWDAVIITASNTSQALGYKAQIDHRRSLDRLPVDTDFIIVPDKDNKRVGSAGSTLSVIRLLKEKYGDLSGRRFLCIHAGGDSKRTPQYSALGKLFSPIPTKIDGIPAALFDMLLISMASIPGRLKEGMLLLSGDVILLFNSLMCDFTSDAAILTFKEDAETGKNHGVCVKNCISGNVKKFLHKQTIEVLKAEGAVDERNNVNIDTGAIALSPTILEKLYALVDTDEKYNEIVNDKVRLSLYGDIAYCLAEESTLDSFCIQQPEGEFCDELIRARTALWNAIGAYSMKCMSVSPSKFVHFGSIPEILKLMDSGVREYESLGWNKQINSSVSNPNVAGYNSILSQNASIGSGCYLEASYVHSEAAIEDNSIISFLEIFDEVIPSNVLVHGLKQNNGRFVCRIMGIHDNPKSNALFGKELDDIAGELGIKAADLWDENDAHILWNAKLYPECDTIREAVKASLRLYNLITANSGERDAWLAYTRKSLCSGFNDADPQAIIDWNTRMEELVRMDELKRNIRCGIPAKEANLGTNRLSVIQLQWLEKELEKLDTGKLEDFSYAMRLYYYLGAALNDESYTGKCFKLIANTVLSSTLEQLKYNENCRIVKDEVIVKLPLRVNWGGGWTDTCPYCLENGGVVLNASISLNGELPVEVKFVRIPERKIVFDSRDMDIHGEFAEIEPLQRTGDPFDPFALQKACLLACGVIPKEGGNLEKILDRLGGGFEMHSEVTNVPRGSGLGTSSILSAAAVKALLTFMGITYTEDTLYATVFIMEQIMSTGGGWQDQVGGVTPGIKFITSFSGIEQKLKVEHVAISDETKKELSERFAIIYTGQRRLARNLLRDVVGRYVGNEPDSLNAHRKIQKVAALMRFALERGNVDEFAELMEEHWTLSKMIDSGSTNTLIDQIFMSIDDMIDARMVCGAGGGGFLQVILKKGIDKNKVHERLKEVFHDFAVDIWDSEIVY